MVAEISPALDDFADFLAGLAPQKLLEYKAAPKVQKRLNKLLAKNKEGNLTPEEQEEISNYMMVEHLVRLAKARSLRHLKMSGK